MSNATGEAMDAELLAEFLTECGELLDQLDVDLVALEANPGERERIDRAFRCLHTIKGTCGFLSLNKLEGLTHAAETLLGAIRALAEVRGAARAHPTIDAVAATCGDGAHLPATFADAQPVWEALRRRLCVDGAR
jgi:two-component system chemotaxis sensor kinase CheA